MGDKTQSPPKVRTLRKKKPQHKAKEFIHWCQGGLVQNHPALYSLGITGKLLILNTGNEWKQGRKSLSQNL